MKLKRFFQLFVLFLVIMLFILPAFATRSLTSSQTVSVTVPETTTVSANYGNSSIINLGPLSPDNTEITIKDIYFTIPSNVDTELWIKASGDLTGTNAENIIRLSNLKYSIPGLDKTGEFTEEYTKAGILRKPKQGINNPKMGVNLKLKVPYGTNSDNYQATIYFTSIKFNSLTPV